MICPYCGGKNNDSNQFCQWCQAELIDTSDIQMQTKSQHIQQKTKQLKRIPYLATHTVCLVILISAVVLGIGGTVFAIFKGCTLDSISSPPQEQKNASLESQIKSAYDQNNYDRLYELIIEDYENTIYCKHYFSYRGVLLSHDKHQDFEAALTQLNSSNTVQQKNAAIIEMCLSYSKLIAEKDSHENLFLDADKKAIIQQMWSLLPALEDQLNQELDYEKEILEKCLNYPLEQLSDLTNSEFKAINFTSYLKE